MALVDVRGGVLAHGFGLKEHDHVPPAGYRSPPVQGPRQRGRRCAVPRSATTERIAKRETTRAAAAATAATTVAAGVDVVARESGEGGRRKGPVRRS